MPPAGLKACTTNPTPSVAPSSQPLVPRSVERDHVERPGRLRSQLPQFRCHLAAVIAAVVHEVLEHLPERRCRRLAVEHLVLERPPDAALAETVDERAHLRLVLE